MSDIFLSYSSKDRQWAKLLADCLQKQGWSVWWDRTIPAGKIFTKVISEALSNARSVVVIWSHESVDSNWVQEEAAEGRDRSNLVPVLREDVKPPMGFRSIQAADLSGWDGNLESPEFKKLIEDLVFILGPPKQLAKEMEQPTISKTAVSKHEVTEPKLAEPSPPIHEAFPEPEPIKPTTPESKPVKPESEADRLVKLAKQYAREKKWNLAFKCLKDVGAYHGDYNHEEANFLLSRIYCPKCKQFIRCPTTMLSTVDYARFWRGYCPKCESQLIIS